ncbi:Uncharacterised protein [Mycobacteroides abscessus subsp. abscessus]|nr:Uncharacterised protein [Mycobacteroides abscessus subsp. abscessus]
MNRMTVQRDQMQAPQPRGAGLAHPQGLGTPRKRRDAEQTATQIQKGAGILHGIPDPVGIGGQFSFQINRLHLCFLP